MCGIAGILRTEPEPAIEAGSGRLLRALAHRGPDGHGSFLSRSHTSALVHTRLAIIDRRQKGAQPMSRHGLTIVFNGEIYNFRALRRELLNDGEDFTTGTDTEVVLALYARHGPACLARLRGMFAFAIWDEATRTCFLARDRFGIKPLYYHVSKNELIFASETKALVQSGLIHPQLDPAGLASYLTTGSVAEPLTLLAGVSCLEAGCWLTWQDGHVETARYFDLTADAPPENPVDPTALTRSALLDSLRHHFVSDVPVGLFLSGGLDSGALLELSHELGQHQLATFSIGLEDASLDEAAAARERAAHFGAQHHEMLLTRQLAANWIECFFTVLDQPTVDGFNTYCISKLAADHGWRVVLSGLGGDELFGGYPSFQRATQLLRLGQAARPLQRIISPLAHQVEKQTSSGRLHRLAAYWQGAPQLSRAYQTIRSVFSPMESDLIGRAVMAEAWQPAVPEAIDPPRTNALNGIYRLEFTRYLRNQLLRDSDVMSMAHGLELRTPFVDHELFTALQAIPAKVRFAPGKALLRDAVPKLAHTAPKRGFTFPFQAWLDGPWQHLKQEIPSIPHVALDSWPRIWSLIVLQRWLRRYNLPLAPT